MTVPEIDMLLHAYWMTMSLEDRMLTLDRLYEAEKSLLDRVAPKCFSDEEKEQFIFYHMHGYEMPKKMSSR